MEGLSDDDRGALVLEACTTGRTDVLKSMAEQGLLDVNKLLNKNKTSTSIKRQNSGNNGSPAAQEETSDDPKDMTTPLHVASENGQVDCVRALLKLGAKVDLVDGMGRLPMNVATEEVRRVFQQEMLQYVALGNVAEVERLLKGGVEVNGGDGTDSNSSALHWAASFGQSKEMLKALVANGANLERTTSKGETPLHEACGSNHVETIRSLIELGANKDAMDNSNKKPFDKIRSDQVKKELASVFNIPLESLQIGAPQRTKSENDMISSSSSSSSKSNGHDSHGRRNTLVDQDEVTELRRMNEEKDMTIVALRETVETLLEKEGVLKYISRLQEEYRTLSAQMQKLEDHKEHLQSMYVKCDAELERALKDNAMLRSTLHEKEERLLEFLDDDEDEDDDSSIKRDPVEPQQGDETVHKNRKSTSSPHRSSSSSSSFKDSERHGSIEFMLLERDRLARELESERRLRFSEARLHLSYVSELQEQLKLAQQLMQEKLGQHQHLNGKKHQQEQNGKMKEPNDKSKEEREQRGFLSSIFYSIWGEDEDDDEDMDGDDYDEEEEESDADSELL